MPRPAVLIVRDGAIGDVVMTTPPVRWWSQQGRAVDVATKPDIGSAVLHCNPHVRTNIGFPSYPSMDDRNAAVQAYRESGEYEYVFDLAGCCEGRYLYHSFRPEYWWSSSFRRSVAAGAHYYETLAQWAGMPTECDEWQRPEMFISGREREKWARIRGAFLGRKIVLLGLAGSGLNKAYPYWFMIAAALQSLDSRIVLLTVGGRETAPLEEAVAESCDKKRLVCTVQDDAWTLRDSLVATAYADLVIAPETGVLNAAACWDVPKIALMTHSSADNLCHGWRNAWPIQSPAQCSPCYRIVANTDPCNHPQTGTDLDFATLCMASISPESIIEAAREALKVDYRRPA